MVWRAREDVLAALDDVYRGGTGLLAADHSMSDWVAWRRIAELQVIRLLGSTYPRYPTFRRALRLVDLAGCDLLGPQYDRNTVRAIRLKDALMILEDIIEDVERNGVHSSEGLRGILFTLVSVKRGHPFWFWLGTAGSIASILGLLLALVL